MDDLFQDLANLSPKERMLFQLLLKENGQQSKIRRIIPRARPSDCYPLSFAQQRLWFLDQLEPSGSFYNIPLAVQLRGPLNRDALEKSLKKVIQRHAVLRATFVSKNGEPVQVIHPNSELGLAVTDLQYLPEEQRQQKARELAHNEAQQSFMLSSQQPVRARILKIDKDDHVLVITMHHIVCDGWSVGILMREVASFYEAFCHGKASLLEELPIQYMDFAVWQKTPQQAEILERQLSYWKVLLRAWKPLELPFQRSTMEMFRAGRGYVEWPANIARELKSLSRREGVTLFMTLLAAFQTLLYRYSGQDQILVGTPTAGRSRTELELLIGCFVNTLVMQSDLSGNPSFRELLGRVKRTVLGAFVNQDVPFEKVVEALQPERSRQHTPIFRVWFVLQNAPLPLLELRGLTLSPVWVSSETSKFDLMLAMQEEAGELLTGIWRYNQDLFSTETIAEMLKHFQVLVESIAKDPDWRLLDIPLVEREQDSCAHDTAVLWSDAEAGNQFNF